MAISWILTLALLHIIIVAIVQGVTEFLPISSSGHLILIPELTGWNDQGLLVDVAVHVGTLLAVLIYFWRDTRNLTLAFLGSIGIRPARRAVADTIYVRLFWALVLATVPVVMVGLVFQVSGLSDALRRMDVIAATSILFGLLLYWADQHGPRQREVGQMTLKAALQIGLAQILALIPGTSRAGITMTAGRLLGFKRIDAARFSMLLAIPTVAAAGLLGTFRLFEQGGSAAWHDAALSAALAFVAALAAIHFLMRWLQFASMTIFVVYRIGLGIGLIAWMAI